MGSEAQKCIFDVRGSRPLEACSWQIAWTVSMGLNAALRLSGLVKEEEKQLSVVEGLGALSPLVVPPLGRNEWQAVANFPQRNVLCLARAPALVLILLVFSIFSLVPLLPVHKFSFYIKITHV